MQELRSTPALDFPVTFLTHPADTTRVLFKKNYKRSLEGRMVYTTKATKQDRIFYNQSQKDTLLAWFEHTPHPNKSTKEQLGKQLGILASKIKNWFKR
jgi:hypothetical protein